jgi:hypothetical protein
MSILGLVFGLTVAIPFSISAIELASDVLVPLSITTTPFLPLEEQSTGQYYYADGEDRYLLLRKAGHTAIGVDGRRSQLLCFRGFVEGDRITNATRIFPPYAPDSRWDARDGTMVDLSRYQQVGLPDDEREEALEKCLEVFAR